MYTKGQFRETRIVLFAIQRTRISKMESVSLRGGFL